MKIRMFIPIVLMWIAALQAQSRIVVSKPKIYDELALRAMLREAEEQLRQVRLINAESLGAGIGNVAGFRRSGSAISLQLQSSPTAGLSETFNVSPDGEVTPSQFTVSRPSVTPPIPDPESLSPSVQPEVGFYGVPARYLLAEQMSLTYQIASLRLLLERSLADRYVEGEYGEQNQAAKVVLLGFDVNVEPDTDARKAVAEIQVSVEDCDAGKAPSLVTLLPTQNMFNVATLRKDIRNIGTGIVAGILPIGFSASKEKETFFVVQDLDTVGVLLQPESDTDLRFGWQFRPVLGRKAVQPGMRQIFALLALPKGAHEKSILKVRVDTRWRKWSAKRMLPTDDIAANDCQCSVYDEALAVKGYWELAHALTPVVFNVNWQYLGAERILVHVRGRNFFSDTVISTRAGSLGIDSGKLRIFDETRLQFEASLQDLVSGDLEIWGRYDAVPLIRLEAPGKAHASVPHVEYLDGKNVRVTIEACGFWPKRPDYSEFNDPLFVAIDQEIYGVDDRPIQEIANNSENSRSLVFVTEAEKLFKASRFEVVSPFQGGVSRTPVKLDRSRFFAPAKAEWIADDTCPLIAIQGSGLTEGVTVRAGSQKAECEPDAALGCAEMVCSVVSADLLLTSFPVKEGKIEKLILTKNGSGTKTPSVILTIGAKPARPKPSFNVEEIEVAEGDVRPVKFHGSNLVDIEKVVFGDKEELNTSVNSDKDGRFLQIWLSDRVTQKKGTKYLRVFQKDRTTPVSIRIKVV